MNSTGDAKMSDAAQTINNPFLLLLIVHKRLAFIGNTMTRNLLGERYNHFTNLEKKRARSSKGKIFIFQPLFSIQMYSGSRFKRRRYHIQTLSYKDAIMETLSLFSEI